MNSSDGIHPLHIHVNSFELMGLPTDPNYHRLHDVVWLPPFSTLTITIAAGIYSTNLPSGLPDASRHGSDFSFAGSGGSMEVGRSVAARQGDHFRSIIRSSSA